MSSKKKSRKVSVPRKPDYHREDYTRVVRIVELGAELLQRAGIKPYQMADGSRGYVVPEWMDTLTYLWLHKGSSIPERALLDAIRAGCRGDTEAVEMFLFTYE